MSNLRRPAKAVRRGMARSPARAESADVVNMDVAGQVYEGARHRGTLMRRWPTRLQSPDAEWFPARDTVVGRTRDQFRNDPIASSAVSRKRNAAVGRGWRFSSKPNARALGIAPEAARELGQIINTEWRLYANSYNFQADAERRLNFGQLLRVQASHLMMDGEFLAQVDYAANDETARYKTCLRLIDPDRLSTPLGKLDGDTIRNGVETNDGNVPIAYHIRQRHPSDIGYSAPVWVRHPRYSTALGRPNILHGLDPDRAGQTRGVPKFASTLKAFRGFSKFTDATIQAATINALILGYVKSGAGPDAISESFSYEDLQKFDGARYSHYQDNAVEMGDAVLPTLAYDDEIQLATASKDVTGYADFTTAIIRLIAAALGLTYEELSMDYSKTNYSSARAALQHAWADTVSFMGTLEAHLVRPFFAAWLEEAFDSGHIIAPEGAPDFHDAIDAYIDGRWLGPGRGYIDAVKEITAAAARIEAGISTLEDECAEQGKDYEEVMEQQAFESRRREELGLSQADAQAAADEDMPDDADARPGDKKKSEPNSAKKSLFGRFKTGALAALSRMASSADHEAFLDARPQRSH